MNLLFFYINIFTHTYKPKRCTRLCIFIMSESNVRNRIKLKNIKRTIAQRHKSNWKNKTVRSNSSIDFCFKKSFAKPFGFKKKVFNSVKDIDIARYIQKQLPRGVLLKKHFPVNCAKLLRTSFLKKYLRWLLLYI